MAASRARFMEKLPLFVRGLYGTTSRKTGDLQILSLNEYVVIDVFYELSCRIAQELWSMNVSSVDPLTNFQVLKISSLVAFAGANLHFSLY